jgi:hypothetical protein
MSGVKWPASQLPGLLGDEEQVPVWRVCTVVATTGALTGLVGAYAYYDYVLRPLAHTFGIWILLVALVCLRQEVMLAVWRSVVTLLAAVTAFYLGKKVMYQIRYSDLPYSISVDDLYSWCLLALVAGVALGVLFHRIGEPNWYGTGATAAAVGLLIADAARRAVVYPDQAPVVCIFAALAVCGLLAPVIPMPWPQALRITLLVIPIVPLGIVVVSIPDAISG